jgi:hypothetical protein
MRDPRHLMRFVKFQALTGSDIERIAAIAKSEGVSKDTIKTSIRQIQMYNSQNETGRVDLRLNESILKVMPAFESSMVGLLEATELVEVNDAKTGTKKIITQDDKTTRLEASRIVKDIIVAKQPKGPLVENNVTNNNKMQVANLSTAETTEERMDRLRKRAAEENLLPAEIAAVPGYLDRDEEKPEEGDEDDEEDDE